MKKTSLKEVYMNEQDDPKSAANQIWLKIDQAMQKHGLKMFEEIEQVLGVEVPDDSWYDFKEDMRWALKKIFKEDMPRP